MTPFPGTPAATADFGDVIYQAYGQWTVIEGIARVAPQTLRITTRPAEGLGAKASGPFVREYRERTLLPLVPLVDRWSYLAEAEPVLQSRLERYRGEAPELVRTTCALLTAVRTELADAELTLSILRA